MHILIAENDVALADGLTRSLHQVGCAADRVSDGAIANTTLSAQTAQTYDLLILDVGLLYVLGLGVLRYPRSRGTMLPVLILAAADSVEERVKGLNLGVDDYMVKPFALSELEARMRVLVRRDTGGGATLVRHRPLASSRAGCIAYIHDQVVELSAREIGLLEILLARVGCLALKEQLVDRLCGRDKEVSSNATEVYIRHLRKKIEVEGAHIATVRGLDYCLERVVTPTTIAVAHG